MTAPQTPPGWYRVRPGVEGWWDGYRWTEHTRPVPVMVQQVQPIHGRTVSYTQRDTNHVLHLILTVLTCGLWLFVWIPVAIANTMRRRKTVTKY